MGGERGFKVQFESPLLPFFPLFGCFWPGRSGMVIEVFGVAASCYAALGYCFGVGWGASADVIAMMKVVK